jgi:hypothetical protein
MAFVDTPSMPDSLFDEALEYIRRDNGLALKELVREVDFALYLDTYDLVDLAISYDSLELVKIFIEEGGVIPGAIMLDAAKEWKSHNCLKYLSTL